MYSHMYKYFFFGFFIIDMTTSLIPMCFMVIATFSFLEMLQFALSLHSCVFVYSYVGKIFCRR